MVYFTINYIMSYYIISILIHLYFMTYHIMLYLIWNVRQVKKKYISPIAC